MSFWHPDQRTLHKDEGLLTNLTSKLGKANEAVTENPYDGKAYQNLLAVQEEISQAIEEHFKKHWPRRWYIKHEQRIRDALSDYELAMRDLGRAKSNGIDANIYLAQQEAVLAYGDCLDAIENHFKVHWFHRFFDFILLG